MIAIERRHASPFSRGDSTDPPRRPGHGAAKSRASSAPVNKKNSWPSSRHSVPPHPPVAPRRRGVTNLLGTLLHRRPDPRHCGPDRGPRRYLDLMVTPKTCSSKRGKFICGVETTGWVRTARCGAEGQQEELQPHNKQVSRISESVRLI